MTFLQLYVQPTKYSVGTDITVHSAYIYVLFDQIESILISLAVNVSSFGDRSSKKSPPVGRVMGKTLPGVG